jgi:hypothetical protein
LALGGVGLTGGGAGAGGGIAAACNPASVSTIGVIGADIQSISSSTLPRAITRTAQ